MNTNEWDRKFFSFGYLCPELEEKIINDTSAFGGLNNK